MLLYNIIYLIREIIFFNEIYIDIHCEMRSKRSTRRYLFIVCKYHDRINHFCLSQKGKGIQFYSFKVTVCGYFGHPIDTDKIY